MAKDPRTVTVHHPEKGSLKVTPEVAVALEAGGYGPYSREVDPDSAEAQVEASVAAATAPLLERIDELEATVEYVVAVGAEQDARLAEQASTPDGERPAPAGQSDPHGDVPDNAEDVIAWVGNDPAKAALARDVENIRARPRKTVTDHIESVLNPTPNDPANNGQED